MRFKKEDYILVALILLCACVFLFAGLGSYSLKEPDEGRYAEIPREMLESGNFVVPHVNYVRYFEKPPLLYWITAASFQVFGLNEWGFRFPNAILAICIALAVFWFGRLWFGSRPAFLSSIVLLSSLGFFAMARIVTTDMCFTFFLTLSLFSFFEYYRKEHHSYLYMSYASAALATLTKGPVAIILLAVTAFLFLVSEWNLGFIRKMRWIKGLSLYFLIVLPWFIIISYAEPAFFSFFFVDQHLLRFFTTKHKRSGPVYYFVPVLFGGLFPWSFLLPRAIRRLWDIREIRFLFLWSLLVFLFFSLSGSKLPPYILPIFPALALIVGHFLCDTWTKDIKLKPELFVYSLIYFLFALFLLAATRQSTVAYIAQFTGQNEIIPLFLSLKTFFYVASAAAIVALACIIAMRKKGISLFLLNTSFSATIIITILFQMSVIDALSTTKPLAVEVNKRQGTYDLLINVSALDHTLPFYTGKRMTMASYKGELEMGSTYVDARPYFITAEQFFTLFSGSQRILAVTKKKKIPLLEELFPDKTRRLLCVQERCLIANY